MHQAREMVRVFEANTSYGTWVWFLRSRTDFCKLCFDLHMWLWQAPSTKGITVKCTYMHIWTCNLVLGVTRFSFLVVMGIVVSSAMEGNLYFSENFTAVKLSSVELLVVGILVQFSFEFPLLWWCDYHFVLLSIPWSWHVRI